jgi:predicted DNA-binding transcriptional regulator AlpA
MKRYLSRPEVAARIGVKKDTLNRYKLPPPDAQIGVRQVGWLPATIDAWHASRRPRVGGST